MAGRLVRSLLSKRKTRKEKISKKQKRQKKVQKEEANNHRTDGAITHVDETVSGCYDVKYKVCKRMDARTFQVSVLHPVTDQDWYEATLRGYASSEEARRILRMTESPTHPSIICALYSDLPQVGVAKIIFKKFYHDSFKDWVKRLPEEWTDDWARDIFCKVFKDITSVLNSLHQSGQYNGALMNSIRISNDNQVQLVEFVEQGLDLIDGIRKDIDDFRNLVKYVLRKKPELNNEGFNCFMGLKHEFLRKAKETGLSLLNNGLMRAYAFFMLHNPLFCDDRGRYNLLYKLLQIRALDVKKFESSVRFDMMKFASWHKETMTGLVLKQFKEKPKRYDKTTSILYFFHDCFNHQQGFNIDHIEIQRAIDSVYPEVLYKLFYTFVKQIGIENKFYGFGVVQYFKEVEPSVSVLHS